MKIAGSTVWFAVAALLLATIQSVDAEESPPTCRAEVPSTEFSKAEVSDTGGVYPLMSAKYLDPARFGAGGAVELKEIVKVLRAKNLKDASLINVTFACGGRPVRSTVLYIKNGQKVTAGGVESLLTRNRFAVTEKIERPFITGNVFTRETDQASIIALSSGSSTTKAFGVCCAHTPGPNVPLSCSTWKSCRLVFFVPDLSLEVTSIFDQADFEHVVDTANTQMEAVYSVLQIKP